VWLGLEITLGRQFLREVSGNLKKPPHENPASEDGSHQRVDGCQAKS
jgi:hypothetical protein